MYVHVYNRIYTKEKSLGPPAAAAVLRIASILGRDPGTSRYFIFCNLISFLIFLFIHSFFPRSARISMIYHRFKHALLDTDSPPPPHRICNLLILYLCTVQFLHRWKKNPLGPPKASSETGCVLVCLWTAEPSQNRMMRRVIGNMLVHMISR